MWPDKKICGSIPEVHKSFRRITNTPFKKFFAALKGQGFLVELI
jgi:hypothetical protein